MNFGTHTRLGLAIEEHSLTAAEVRGSGDEAEVLRTAEFAFPDGCSLDEPERLGAALGEFLADKGFSALRAALGTPAAWFVAREKLVPSEASSKADILRVQAEREFSTPLEDLRLDFAPAGEADGKDRVLLLAAKRPKVDAAVTMARAAGLKVKAVTPSGMALARAGDGGEPGNICTFLLYPGGGDCVFSEAGHVRIIKHLPMTGQPAGQLRRELAALPQDRSPATLVLWNGTGRDEKALRAAAETLGLAVRTPDTLAAGGQPAIPVENPRFAAAVALAANGDSCEPYAVDFAHSRFSAGRSRLPGRRVVYAALAGLAVLVIAASLGTRWQGDREQVASLQSRLQQMKPEINEARNLIEKVSSAQDWFRKKPRYLNCLREVTMAFPESGSVWTTSLAMQRDMRCVLTGRADDRRSVIRLRRDMEGHRAFSALELLYMRQSGTASDEVAFAIGFQYIGNGAQQ